MAARCCAITSLGIVGLLAGCSAIPFGGDRSRPAPPPAPLAAAPTGSVSAAPLPPPPASTVPTTAAQPSGLAALDPSLQGGTVPAAAAPAAASQVEVGRTDLLGGWTINAAGETCQLFMTLTTWSGGYRASTRGCKNPELQKISAWNLEGSQVQLFNDSNTTVARLFAASKTQYNGQAEGGGPVTVSR
jgi:hypothetical protein